VYRIGFAVLAILCAPGVAAAQGAVAEREAVRQAVLDYVEGFYQGDSTRFVRSVSPRVFKYGYFVGRDSAYTGSQMTWPQFHAYANRVKEQKRFQPATATKRVDIYEVLDQTASAKLTAYWGIDYLLLAKENGRWMITHVLWQTPPKQ
jgi:hypothetical protein